MHILYKFHTTLYRRQQLHHYSRVLVVLKTNTDFTTVVLALIEYCIHIHHTEYGQQSTATKAYGEGYGSFAIAVSVVNLRRTNTEDYGSTASTPPLSRLRNPTDHSQQAYKVPRGIHYLLSSELNERRLSRRLQQYFQDCICGTDNG